MMNYKGYIGTVEYDDENRVFTGSVVNTRAVAGAKSLGLSLNSFVKKSVEDELKSISL